MTDRAPSTKNQMTDVRTPSRVNLLRLVGRWLTRQQLKLDSHCRRNQPVLYALYGSIIIVGVPILAGAYFLVFLGGLLNINHLLVPCLLLIAVATFFSLLFWAALVTGRFQSMPVTFSAFALYRFYYLVVAAFVIELPLLILFCLPVSMYGWSAGTERADPTSAFLTIYIIFAALPLVAGWGIHSMITEYFSIEKFYGEVPTLFGVLVLFGIVLMICLAISSEAKTWWEDHLFSAVFSLISALFIFPFKFTVYILYTIETFVVIITALLFIEYVRELRERSISAIDLRMLLSIMVALLGISAGIISQLIVLGLGLRNQHLIFLVVFSSFAAATLLTEWVYVSGAPVTMGPRR